MTAAIPRWIAVARYRSSRKGEIVIEHRFEELHELHELIESGPSWLALKKIEIRYALPHAAITVEEEKSL